MNTVYKPIRAGSHTYDVSCNSEQTRLQSDSNTWGGVADTNCMGKSLGIAVAPRPLIAPSRWLPATVAEHPLAYSIYLLSHTHSWEALGDSNVVSRLAMEPTNGGRAFLVTTAGERFSKIEWRVFTV